MNTKYGIPAGTVLLWRCRGHYSCQNCDMLNMIPVASVFEVCWKGQEFTPCGFRAPTSFVY